MINNKVKSIDSYVSKKTRSQEDEKINLAKLHGFETYEDYQFFVAKACMSDCRFSLAKVYYENYENYLLQTLNAFLNYLKTGSIVLITSDNKKHSLTNYSLNELVDALSKDDKILQSKLDDCGISATNLISLIAQTNIVNDKTAEFTYKLKKEN